MLQKGSFEKKVNILEHHCVLLSLIKSHCFILFQIWSWAFVSTHLQFPDRLDIPNVSLVVNFDMPKRVAQFDEAWR